MSVSSPLTRLGNLLVTVAAGPGILTHEYAHYAACRLTGVPVREAPSLDLFGDSAVLKHDPVSAFAPDFAIAVAPFLSNSTLAFAAFGLAGLLSGPVSFVGLWLGVCFGFTAIPSRDDTTTLLSTAASLPPTVRPLGYLVAYPLRTVTRSVAVGGLLALVWTWALLVGSVALV